MKKHLTFLSLPLLFLACTSEVPDEPTLKPLQTPTQFRAIDDALTVALDVASQYTDGTSSRAGERTASAKNVITRSCKSRSTDEPMYYIVNFDDGQGYAIVATPTSCRAFVGYVPEGSYVPDTNPALEEYLSLKEEQLSSQMTLSELVLEDGLEPMPDPSLPPRVTYQVIDTNYMYHCDPRMPQEWGEDNIYGQFCRNKRAGCAATAIGSIAVWTNYKEGIEKTNIRYTYNGRDLESENIEWTELFKHRWISTMAPYPDRDHLCYTHNPEEVHKTIGRLFRQIGEDLHADYTTFETYTSSQYLYDALDKYVPATYTITPLKDYVHTALNRYIDYGLLLVTGKTKVWVGDGYHIVSRKMQKTTYYVDQPFPKFEFYEEIICDIHMRWGQHGKDDGYFSADFKNAPDTGDKFIGIHKGNI